MEQAGTSLLHPISERSGHHPPLFTIPELSERRDDKRLLRQIKILARTFHADVLLVCVLINRMRNDDIPAVRVFGCKFVETVTSHVHHHIALFFDNVISTADHLVRIMRTDIVARIHEPGPTGPEKAIHSFRRQILSGSSQFPSITSSGHWKWMMS